MKFIIEQRADPFAIFHSGRYYFTASVPQYDRIELRCASSLEALSGTAPLTIWQAHNSGPMSAHIWAPEIHRIDGHWYIYFAASEKEDIWKLRPYVLVCKGSDPMRDPWQEAGPMLAAENDPYSFTDFSLDATILQHRGDYYCIWAQKVGGQFGISNLYIAQMKTATRLKTVAVLLSTPDYDWERVDFWVNEGPAALKHNGKIYLTYSASGTGSCYCMGLLQADEDSDLLDPRSWRKSRWPVLKSDETLGIYGPGHNCFTTLPNGKPAALFHARSYSEITGEPLYDPNRHTHMVPLQWAENGDPLFDLYRA